MASPIQQKTRPIALVLWGGGVPAFHYFNVRPEDLHYEIPSRSNVHQTLGGAWVDDFGVGLKQITLSGTTGWRGAALPGELWFLTFRELVYELYFARRQQVANLGVDPDTVRLFYVDTLNYLVCWVHPTEFHHERSRSHPLLHRYRIQLAVVAELGLLSMLNRGLSGINNAITGVT